MIFVAPLLLLPLLLVAGQAPTCGDVSSCRQAALDAASRQDFEAFHDLAWRAAQKGRPNDPDLMYLLARAQSLSGRPGDALVMLRRLAELGVATDAGDNDDFRRVRALSGWPDVEALILKSPEQPSPNADRLRNEAAAAKPRSASKLRAPATPAASVNTTTNAAPVADALTTAAEDTLRLEETALDPIGLAYDAASRRFVVGDRHLNKLIVADEVFKRVNDLIGARSAGFGTLTGVEIDPRRGDLWVTSSGSDGAASIHKLQLVSGRVLSTLELPEDLRPATFEDMSIVDSGSLLLLDSAGSRLWTVKAGSRAFDRPINLRVMAPRSVATAGTVVYVAHPGGLATSDPISGRTKDVRATRGIALTGLRRIRSNHGGLIAIQSDKSGSDRLVRIRFGRDGAVSAIEALDSHASVNGSALTISRDAAYYVARTENGPVIRRVPLR